MYPACHESDEACTTSTSHPPSRTPVAGLQEMLQNESPSGRWGGVFPVLHEFCGGFSPGMIQEMFKDNQRHLNAKTVLKMWNVSKFEALCQVYVADSSKDTAQSINATWRRGQ